jgi:hypothetical protein
MSEPTLSGPVLIVEDEFLVAIHVEGILQDLGFDEIHWAHSLETAERALAAGPPALAILDINVGPKLVYPFAERLREVCVPFVFSSGGAELPQEWAEYPFVPKPLDQDTLAAVLKTVAPRPPPRPRTLGDVLYADSRTAPPEQEWWRLVRLVAAGDQIALHQLYERAHQPVLTLITCITSSPEAAEDLSIEVFHDIWRRASEYDGKSGSVLGWIMNLARAHAIERARFDGANAVESMHSGRSDAPHHLGPARPHTTRLQARLSLRIAVESDGEPVMPPAKTWREPQWDAVAPGIDCKLLAADADQHRVSMLVRLAPGASYPPHTHAGAEELHLLDGELWIDERKLCPGDYNFGQEGAGDDRVWSETGCTCVLITSTRDVLR